MQEQLARLRLLIEQLIQTLHLERKESERLRHQLYSVQAELEQAKQRLHTLQQEVRHHQK